MWYMCIISLIIIIAFLIHDSEGGCFKVALFYAVVVFFTIFMISIRSCEEKNPTQTKEINTEAWSDAMRDAFMETPNY